jgi:hypothetical protein
MNNSRIIGIFSAHYFNDDFFPYGKTFAYLKGLGFDSFQVMQSSLRSSFLYKEKMRSKVEINFVIKTKMHREINDLLK